MWYSSPPGFSDEISGNFSDTIRQCKYPAMPIEISWLSGLSIPSGFYQLAKTGILSFQTLNSIQRVAERGDFNIRPSAFSTTTDFPVAESASLEGSASHFVNFHEACPALTLPNDSEGQPPLEKVMCLALIRYCLNGVNGERPALRCYAHNLTLELRQQLIPDHRHTTILTDALQQRSKIPQRDVDDPVKKMERESMIWMWLMAIDTWCLPKFELSNAGKLLLMHVLDVFEEIRDMSTEEFEDLGKRWFWTDNLRGIVKRYICGAQRFDLFRHARRTLEDAGTV